MLALFLLLVATYATNAFYNLAAGIPAGTTTPEMVMNAAMMGVLTNAEMARLVQMMQQQAAAAAAAASASCNPTQSADRFQTPINNGILGYGDNACADLPAPFYTNPVVSDNVPDLSGVYTQDGGWCGNGNTFRIEQNGEDIIIVGARMVHHFMKEEEGCEAVLEDYKAGCAGRDLAQAGAMCSTGKVTAIPDNANNCWNLEASFVVITWCKTADGVSRSVNGNLVAQTFTAVTGSV